MRVVINTHLHLEHCGQTPSSSTRLSCPAAGTDTRRSREEAATEWFDCAGARFELVDGTPRLRKA